MVSNISTMSDIEMYILTMYVFAYLVAQIYLWNRLAKIMVPSTKRKMIESEPKNHIENDASNGLPK